MIETGPKVLPTPPLQYPLSGKQMKIRMKPIQSKPIRSKVSLTFSPTPLGSAQSGRFSGTVLELFYIA